MTSKRVEEIAHELGLSNRQAKKLAGKNRGRVSVLPVRGMPIPGKKKDR